MASEDVNVDLREVGVDENGVPTDFVETGERIGFLGVEGGIGEEVDGLQAEANIAALTAENRGEIIIGNDLDRFFS